MKWISVKDRLPNLDDTPVLTYSSERPQKIHKTYFCNEFSIKLEKITHWMPVTKPPNGETHDG